MKRKILLSILLFFSIIAISNINYAQTLLDFIMENPVTPKNYALENAPKESIKYDYPDEKIKEYRDKNYTKVHSNGTDLDNNYAIKNNSEAEILSNIYRYIGNLSEPNLGFNTNPSVGFLKSNWFGNRIEGDFETVKNKKSYMNLMIQWADCLQLQETEIKKVEDIPNIKYYIAIIHLEDWDGNDFGVWRSR